MQQEFAALKEFIETGDYTSVAIHFRSYCQAFKSSVLNEQPQSFFAKIIKKQTPLELGIKDFEYMVQKKVLPRINYMEFIQSIMPLFQSILNPFIRKDIHLKSFKLLLDIASAFEVDYEEKQYTLKNIGDIIVYGLQLYQFIDKNTEMYNDIVPSINIDYEQDVSSLHLELYSILVEHISDHISSFDFWWSLLCESFFPIYFGPDSKTPYSFNREPGFDLGKISEILCSKDINASKVSHLYPSYIMHLIAATADMSTVPFFSRFIDFYEGIFQEAADSDYHSVSSFLVSVLPRLGSKLQSLGKEGTIEFDKQNKVWSSFVRKHGELAELILNEMSQRNQISVDPTTIYAMLLMSYQLSIPMPKEIATQIVNMSTEVKSVACAFSGILAVIFMPQILRLSLDDIQKIEDDAFNDCGAYFLRVAYNKNAFSIVPQAENMGIVDSLSIPHDPRPAIEVAPFLEQFFEGWERNCGIHEMCASFARTLILIIQSLPFTIQVDAKRVLIPLMDKFTQIAIETSDPKIVLSSVDVVSLILSTRNIVPHIKPAAITRTATAHIKLLCINNKECMQVGILRASYSILSGNPILMTIIPFMVTLIKEQEITVLQPVVVSALECALLYCSQNSELVLRAVNAIEGKMLKMLSKVMNNLSQTASSYFVGGKRDQPNKMQNINDTIISIIINEIRTTPYEEVQLSFVRLVHGYSVLNIDIPKQFDVLFQHSRLMNDNIFNGMYSLIDVAYACNERNKIVLEMIIAFIELAYTQDLENTQIPSEKLAVLHFRLCIAGCEWDMLRRFLSRMKNKRIIEAILCLMSERNIKEPSREITHRGCTSLTSKDSRQIVQLTEDNNVEVITTKGVTKSVHSFTKMEIKEEEKSLPEKEPIEDSENEEEDFENSTTQTTTQIFTKIIEEIKAQHEEDLLSTIEIEPQTPRKRKTMPFEEQKKTETVEAIDNTPYDVSLTAIGLFGLFGTYGYEKRIIDREIAPLNQMLSIGAKPTYDFPIYYSKGGKMDWNWKMTSKSFQRFSHALNNDTFYDWRINGKFTIIPACDKSKDAKVTEKIKVIWCDDGITISPEELKNNGVQPTVISLQPLRIGFVRVRVENAKMNNLLLSNTKVVPGQSVVSLLKTTLCSIIANTEGKYFPYAYLNATE